MDENEKLEKEAIDYEALNADEEPQQGESVDDTVEPEETPKAGKKDIFKIISNALKAGTIDSATARSMKNELGMDFTKKKVDGKVRKKKLKAQKNARKATRKQGFKGQKVNKGNTGARGR